MGLISGTYAIMNAASGKYLHYDAESRCYHLLDLDTTSTEFPIFGVEPFERAYTITSPIISGDIPYLHNSSSGLYPKIYTDSRDTSDKDLWMLRKHGEGIYSSFYQLENTFTHEVLDVEHDSQEHVSYAVSASPSQALTQYWKFVLHSPPGVTPVVNVYYDLRGEQVHFLRAKTRH